MRPLWPSVGRGAIADAPRTPCCRLPAGVLGSESWRQCSTTRSPHASARPRDSPRSGPDRGRPDPGPLVRAYYRNVAAEDVCERPADDLYGALASHLDLARNRPQGTARVRVLTPGPEDGWSARGHSLVQVVTDDMPFLVDSLTMELARQDRDVRLVIHPQMDVVRDITGELKSVTGVEDGSVAAPEGAVRESWMQVEVSRVTEETEAAALEEALQRVLGDVRHAVDDWPRMQAQAMEIVDELGTEPLPLPGWEVSQGQDLLRWLAHDHFTFLGYREYRLETDGEDDVLRAMPGTGLGILRFDQDMSASFGKLPPAVRALAREKTLLVLAKANSRATVHRPAYLDYVGIKSFDAAGEVVGERRFLGLFSSAAYTESVLRIPLVREKAREVLKRAGFDPRSHAGKALMDTLENFPRDELFHMPTDDLATTAVAVMHARERRQVKIFIRKDTYGRYVTALVYLPRDRYNTNVRERFARILKEQLRRRDRRVLGPAGGVGHRERPLRGPPAEGRGDPRGRPGRPGADAGRGLPLVARRLRVRGHGRVRRGPRRGAGPRVRRLLPRGLQGGLPGGDRRRRPRPARQARPGRGGRRHRHPALPQGRRQRGRGSAEGVPHRLGALALRDPADALLDGRRGRRRAPLRAGRPRPADLRLRVRAALRQAGRSRDTGPVPGRAAGGVGRLQRDRRLQPAGPRRRADVAAGHRAAGLREVHAAGKQPVRAGLHRGCAGGQRRHHAAAGAALRDPLRPGRPRRGP